MKRQGGADEDPDGSVDRAAQEMEVDVDDRVEGTQEREVSNKTEVKASRRR